jgi:hypothetical protein
MSVREHFMGRHIFEAPLHYKPIPINCYQKWYTLIDDNRINLLLLTVMDSVHISLF